MNHTYASITPSDSDPESPAMTPTGDLTPSSTRKNSIRDLIKNYEHKLKFSDDFKIPPDIKLRILEKGGQGKVTDKGGGEMEGEENDYVNVQKKKVKAELTRTLTQIRKNYVRRVCSTVRRRSEKEDDNSPHLFECCLLVELNMSNLTPYVKGKYPTDFSVPPWVEHLCYPDAPEWSPESLSSGKKSNQACQCYSLVITNEKGERKFGYCRRVLPEEASVCLPLTYCIISTFRAPGFYHKVLQELESRHGLPHWIQSAFLGELYNSKFPQPGQAVKISCLLKVLLIESCKKSTKHLSDNGNDRLDGQMEEVDDSNNSCERKSKKSEEKNEYRQKNKDELEIRLDNMKNGYGCLQKSNEELNKDWVIFDKGLVEDYSKEMQKNIYSALKNIKLEKNDFTKIDNYVREFRETLRVSDANRTQFLEPGSVHNITSVQSSLLHKSDRRTICSMSGIDLNTPCSSLLDLPNSQLIHDCLLGDVVFKRPYDHRIEETDLTVLFETLNLNVLLQAFGSLLLERKVVFVSKCLSTVSSCVEALQSILYPFSWQHTFIPVLSSNLLDILGAPLPLVAGVLASHIKEQLIVEEGIAIDLDTSTVLCSVGDERGIIPKRLRHGLCLALQLVTSSSSVDGSRNVLVSEAFVRMFVEVCGQYKHFITNGDGVVKVFDREAFIKQHPSKTVQMFLDWFSETAMFSCFIQTHLEGSAVDSIFEQRCTELQNEKHKNNAMKKVKNFFKS